MYEDFALVYDRLMAGVDYASWAAHYGRLLERAGIDEGALVTECACGTGSLSQHLARRYRLTGLDSSQEMLSIAAEKLRAQGLSVPLVKQDMRRMRLMKPQDALLCTCDGVNYLSTDAALRQFLRSANRALRPGGALCFDVSSHHKLSQQLGDRTFVKTDGDIRYIWQNSYDERTRLLQLSLQIFLREADGRFRLIEEEQQQRAWTAEELHSALSSAGFGPAEVFGGLELAPPTEEEQRLHLLCIKERDPDD